jgi:preprotein translocase SecF subunit
MRSFSFIPPDTKLDFVKQRFIFLAISAVIVFGSMGSYFTKGLNFGIDFKGGLLIEIRTPEELDLSALRTELNNLDLGDVKLQGSDDPRDIMIRIESQPGGEEAQSAALEKIKASIGSNVEYRRIETVGPKVSETLIKNGFTALIFALLAMLVYIWLRFEWQYGLCAILAQIHDCISIIGLYAILGLEFNETAIIAILTTAGYSINDTVVIYDRIRENLRKFKKMPMPELINMSINQTLSRTSLTSFTTLLALCGLYFFGGQVIQNFTLPIICGIIVGTYSSICFASILLLYFKLPNMSNNTRAEEAAYTNSHK